MKMDPKTESGEIIGLQMEPGKGRIRIAVCIGIMALLATFLFARYFKPYPVFIKRAPDLFPSALGGWEEAGNVSRGLPIGKTHADWELSKIYRKNPQTMIGVTVYYFAIQEKGKELTDLRYYWGEDEEKSIKISTGNTTLEIKRVNPFRKPHSAKIYYWYDINGRILSRSYEVKLMTVWEFLKQRRTNGAIVMITPQFENGSADTDASAIPFIRAALPEIQGFLNKAGTHSGK
jgi:EpsI family protein